jgi:hypothetical protein
MRLSAIRAHLNHKVYSILDEGCRVRRSALSDSTNVKSSFMPSSLYAETLKTVIPGRTALILAQAATESNSTASARSGLRGLGDSPAHLVSSEA